MAGNPLTQQQNQFAARLASLTGLNQNVIRAWELAEESGGAARTRAQQGNNNWLNIGYYDSGAAGWAQGGGPFANPNTAAQATAQFLQGKRWGAAQGIRDILNTAGQSPENQIRAIYTSPWASGHYHGGASITGAYQTVSGMPVANPPTGPTTATTTAATTPPTLNTPQIPPPQMVSFTPKPGAVNLGLQNLQGVANMLGSRTHTQVAKIPLPQAPTFQVAMPQAPIDVHTVDVPLNQPGHPNENQLDKTGRAALTLARTYLGTAYKWGGASPATGFDCSGLVQYVYGQQGVKLPRVAADQFKTGQHVDLKHLLPGDAVFFRDSSGIHHEGLYIGNNQFLHAPHTGDVVKISSLSGSYAAQFAGGRRYG